MGLHNQFLNIAFMPARRCFVPARVPAAHGRRQAAGARANIGCQVQATRLPSDTSRVCVATVSKIVGRMAVKSKQKVDPIRPGIDPLERAEALAEVAARHT